MGCVHVGGNLIWNGRGMRLTIKIKRRCLNRRNVRGGGGRQSSNGSSKNAAVEGHSLHCRLGWQILVQGGRPCRPPFPPQICNPPALARQNSQPPFPLWVHTMSSFPHSPSQLIPSNHLLAVALRVDQAQQQLAKSFLDPARPPSPPPTPKMFSGLDMHRPMRRVEACTTSHWPQPRCNKNGQSRSPLALTAPPRSHITQAETAQEPAYLDVTRLRA